MTPNEYKAAIKAKDKEIEQLKSKMLNMQIAINSLLFFGVEIKRKAEVVLKNYGSFGPERGE